MDAVLPIFFELREESPTLITDKYPPLTRDGASLVLTACIMMVLTTLWTIMRLISRRITGISFHTEDYLDFSGQLLYYGVATCFILGVILGGAGHDVSVLDPNLHVSHFVKIFLAAQVMYATELLAIKLSIITLMQRIFSQSSSWFRATSWVAVGLSCIWALYTALLGFTGCGDYTLAFSAVAIFDIITDIVIVVLPIKVVSGLQMARAHKVALCVVFGAGVRLYYTLTADFVNITRGFASASISGVLQSGIAVMKASSPMLRPVFDRTIVRWLSLSIRSRSQGHIVKSSKSSQLGSHLRGDGFKQMSDSDENLSWEMQGLGSRTNCRTGRVSQAQISAGIALQNVNTRSPTPDTTGIATTRTVAVERHSVG
ncbi:hypothetical protein BDP81DRAFT_503657 [Colletotrichum phormii]|uniref:Rhodopsin domain-containing protein n=1 Tax=Colletotrichum phormii TaxID=359342 RepID=A0AAI9ZF40_9PEZI|nr:uncharacterized protein BDP81DRAFT_503657 [Colletotrichum phormii]KAK1623397.1 hypothetical protein BDP81DRAFT_503657 [Colletotrichum phormii]